MAAVSGPARHSRVSMSVSMSLMQGGTQSAPQGAILAAAAPYYQTPAIPTDVQPDRPIGYGAFGVAGPFWRSVPRLCVNDRVASGGGAPDYSETTSLAGRGPQNRSSVLPDRSPSECK
ncbi:unnamed protein product, partial [Iphiclides podalirius]